MYHKDLPRAVFILAIIAVIIGAVFFVNNTLHASHTSVKPEIVKTASKSQLLNSTVPYCLRHGGAKGGVGVVPRVPNEPFYAVAMVLCMDDTIEQRKVAVWKD